MRLTFSGKCHMLPGVYIFRDSEGMPLYSQAKSLWSRIRSNFRPSQLSNIRTHRLLELAQSTEFSAPRTQKRGLFGSDL